VSDEGPAWDTRFSFWVLGFKSGWGYFANHQQMVNGWLNRRKKLDSICCQPWPRALRFRHGYGNPLSTSYN
jgi:hypothetical protein